MSIDQYITQPSVKLLAEDANTDFLMWKMYKKIRDFCHFYPFMGCSNETLPL